MVIIILDVIVSSALQDTSSPRTQSLSPICSEPITTPRSGLIHTASDQVTPRGTSRHRPAGSQTRVCRAEWCWWECFYFRALSGGRRRFPAGTDALQWGGPAVPGWVHRQNGAVPVHGISAAGLPVPPRTPRGASGPEGRGHGGPEGQILPGHRPA